MEFKLDRSELEQVEQFRRRHSTAVLTVLFTDIVGYTHFAEEAGENASNQLREYHDKLFIECVTAEKGGEIVKQIGDSFLAIFAEPSTAVLRALEFQQSIEQNRKQLTRGNYTLQVRIGIHMGQVSQVEAIQNDIFGRHVNRASRIESIAKGGQILTSYSVWENAVGWLKSEAAEIGFIPHGRVQLKGLDDRPEIYEFFWKKSGSKGVPQPILQVKLKKRRLIFASTVLGVVFAVFFSILGWWESMFSRLGLIHRRPDTVKLYLSSVLSPREISKWEDTDSNYVAMPDSERVRLTDELYRLVRSKLYNRCEIVTHEDIVVEAAKTGVTALDEETLFKRIVIAGYDMDTVRSVIKHLGCNSGFFFVAHRTKGMSPDTLSFRSYVSYLNGFLVKYDNAHQREFIDVAVDNLTDAMNSYEKILENTGKVLTVENGAILAQFGNPAKLKRGMAVFAQRLYYYGAPFDTGCARRLADLEAAISFYGSFEKWQAAEPDTNKVFSPREYRRLKLTGKGASNSGKVGIRLPMKLEVEEVKDKTVKLRVYSSELRWLTIKAGDVLELE